MKVIKRGSRGEEVRIWQAMINAPVDGSFGPDTDKRTKQWQCSRGLAPDGSVGPATQRAAGIMQSHKSLYVFRIPFSAIKKADLLLASRQQLSSFDTGYSFLVNGGMFDMPTGRNVTDLVIKGKLDNGGNYTNKGLKFQGSKITPAITSDCVGKACSFLGGGPSLISLDMKGLPRSFYTSSTQRMAYGVTEGAFYIITTGQAHKCSLDTVLSEAKNQGITTMIGGDGGGSTAMRINGATVFTAGRPIPTSIGIVYK